MVGQTVGAKDGLQVDVLVAMTADERVDLMDEERVDETVGKRV